jgi:DNA-directed RNA polymerase specialized sigma24 family protein
VFVVLNKLYGGVVMWKESVKWVDDNKTRIKLLHSYYCRFSTYDESDFFQEAYLVAYSASKFFPVSHNSFSGTFWNLFRKTAKFSLATDPCVGDVLNFPTEVEHAKISRASEAYRAFREPVCFVSFDESIHSPSDVGSVSRPGTTSLEYHRIVPQMTRFLLKNQRDVFESVLGLCDGGALTFSEAADKLGRRKGEVSKIYKNACNRVKRLVKEGKISVPGLEEGSRLRLL